MDKVFIKGGPIDQPRALVLLAGGAEEQFLIKPGESASAFRDRIFAYAQGRGAASVIFGGLPNRTVVSAGDPASWQVYDGARGPAKLDAIAVIRPTPRGAEEERLIITAGVKGTGLVLINLLGSLLAPGGRVFDNEGAGFGTAAQIGVREVPTGSVVAIDWSTAR